MIGGVRARGWWTTGDSALWRASPCGVRGCPGRSLSAMTDVLLRHELRGPARRAPRARTSARRRGTGSASCAGRTPGRRRSPTCGCGLPPQRACSLQPPVVADRCLLWLLGVDVLPPGPPVLEVVVPRGAVVPSPRRSARPHRRGRRRRTAGSSGRSGCACLRPARAVADLLRLLPLGRGGRRRRRRSARRPVRLRHAAARARGMPQACAPSFGPAARSSCPTPGPSRRPSRGCGSRSCEAGLAPVPQYEVLDAHGRFVARVDLALPDAAHRDRARRAGGARPAEASSCSTAAGRTPWSPRVDRPALHRGRPALGSGAGRRAGPRPGPSPPAA